MVSKRGITQADWIISIAIFILYLAWFFIVITPVLNPVTKESLPADELKDAFMGNASWEVNITPIILRSNITSSSVPIVMDFPFPGNALNYALIGKYRVIDDRRLIFLADFTASPVIYNLVHSSFNYTKPAIQTNMVAGENEAESGNMEVSFDDGIIDDVRYRDALRIVRFSMQVDGNALNTNINGFSSTSISAKYKVRTPSLNNTFYVLENNSMIYGFVDATEEKNVDIDFVLHEYKRYFADSQNQGSITYNVTECDNFETDFIDFTDGDYGLAFIFSDDVSIRMCHDSSLVLNISASADNNLNYRAVFHEASAGMDDLIMPYTAVFGATNIYEGLSGSNMFDLESTNYSVLKSDWNMKHDFNITVYNSTAEFLSIGRPPYRNTEVHSKQYYAWMLNEYADQKRVVINILLW